eukprot:jgi/Mesvir1/15796/Mv03360-RA.1
MVSKTHARAGEPRAIGAGDRQGSRPAGLERVQSRKVERARSLFFTCSPDADTATALVSLLDPVVAILPNNNSEDICMAWSSLSKGSFDADAPQVRNLLKALGFQFKPIIDVNDDDAPPAFMAIMPASKARKKSSVILAVYELCNRVLSAPPVTCDGGHTAGDAAKYMAKEACENAVNIAANSSAANNAVNNSAKRGASNVATDVAGQACQLALPDHFNNGETPATNEWGDVAGPTSMALDVVAGPPSPGKPAKRKWGVTLRADTPEFSPLDKKAKEEVVKDKECPMQAMAGQPVAPQMPTDSTEAVMVGDFNDTAITQRGLLARIKPPSHKSRHPRHSPRRSRGQPLCRVMPHSRTSHLQGWGLVPTIPTVDATVAGLIGGDPAAKHMNTTNTMGTRPIIPFVCGDPPVATYCGNPAVRGDLPCVAIHDGNPSVGGDQPVAPHSGDLVEPGDAGSDCGDDAGLNDQDGDDGRGEQCDAEEEGGEKCDQEDLAAECGDDEVGGECEDGAGGLKNEEAVVQGNVDAPPPAPPSRHVLGTRRPLFLLAALMQASARPPPAPRPQAEGQAKTQRGGPTLTLDALKLVRAQAQPPAHASPSLLSAWLLQRTCPPTTRSQAHAQASPNSAPTLRPAQAQAQAMRPAQTQQAQTSPLEALVLLPEPALADATAQAQPSVGPSQADNDPLSQPPRARTPDKLLAPAQQPVGLAPQGQQALLPLPPPPPLTLAPRTVVSPHGTQVLTFMPPPPRRMTSQRGALALPRPPAPAPPELASNNVPGNVELGGFPAANGKLGNPDQGCTRRQVHRLCPGTAPRPPKQQWLAREAHQPPQPLPQPQPQPLSQPQPQPRPHPAPWLVAAWDRNGLKPQATTWPSLDAAAPPLWMGDDSSRPPMWTPMRPSLPFQCVRLSEESVEFLYWASRMDIFGIRVTSVTRIQNPHLWDMYVAQRLAMTRKKVGPAGEGEALKPGLAPYNLNESLLYHCSSEPDHKKICLEGLDHRLSAGGRFGHGVYLTDDPRKASNYARGTHRLYVCAVLLGDTLALPDKVASPCDWRREPEKALVDRRRTSDTRFDSVVGRRCRSNGTTGANEFVTYDRFTTCPLYMVEYRGDESGFKRGDDVPWAVRKVPDFAFKYPAPRPSWFCSLLYGHGHGNDGGDPYSPFGCVPPDKPGDDSRWDLFLKSYYQVVAPASAAGMVACASTATAAEVLCAIDDVDDDCIDDGMGFFDESDVRGAVG